MKLPTKQRALVNKYINSVPYSKGFKSKAQALPGLKENFEDSCEELNISKNIIPAAVIVAQRINSIHQNYENHINGMNQDKKSFQQINVLRTINLDQVNEIRFVIKTRSKKDKVLISAAISDWILIEDLINAAKRFIQKWPPIESNGSQQILSKLTSIICTNLDSYLTSPDAEFHRHNNEAVSKNDRMLFIGLILYHSKWPLFANQETNLSGVQRVARSKESKNFQKKLADFVRQRVVRTSNLINANKQIKSSKQAN